MTDTQHIVDTYHQVDPVSGMIHTTGNYATAFTPERKQQFIDVYKSSGLRFRQTCINMGLSYHTVNHHLTIDPEFKTRYHDAQADYYEELEANQRAFALDKKNFMDRAMQLRYGFPEKYARDENRNTSQPVQITLNGDLIIGSKNRDEMIDARVVKAIEVESASMNEQHNDQSK